MKEDQFMHISCIEYFVARAKLVDSIKLELIGVAECQRYTRWELTRYYTLLTGSWLETVKIN